MGSNTKGTETVAVDKNREWSAFDRLPKVVRDIAREECAFDYSAEQLLEVWNNYCYRDVTYFREFMRNSDKTVIAETKSIWPQPNVRKTTAYERAIARKR
jgi:hypothetical protein